MQPFNDAARLLRVPRFLPAATALLLVVLGQAVSGTFLALFAVRRAGMSPLELSVFLTASALASIAASTLLGRRFDRHPDAAALLIVLAMNAAGLALLAVTTDFIWLVVIAAIPVGVGGAAFTLLFALAKRQLDAVDATTAERGVAALRMLSSLGWAIGPALGAVLVSWRGYPGVFLGAAVCIVISLVTVLMSGIWRLPQSARAAAMTDAVSVPKGRAALAVGSIGLFHMAMFMGSIALSITLVERLGGSESDVGLLFSLCAALEVLVMGCFVIWPTRGSRALWMLSGFALFALYFVWLIAFPTLAMAYWAQIPRAVAIGIVSVVGMIYLQSLMPSRVGLAAALFGNAVSVGAILSGSLTGPWASAFGYAAVFWLCVALTVAGATLIVIRKSSKGP
jgi:SET family sugar efflux transporter-like MFS transporter